MKRTIGLAFAAAVLGSLALPAWAEDASTAEARGLVERAEYSEALKLIERISDPEDAALLRAEVLFRTGKLAEAEKQAAKAEKDEKRKLEAVTLRGEIQAAQGKLSEAEQTFRSIEAEPLSRRARLRLGELLIQTGRRKDARKVLLTLIADYNSDAISASDALGLSYVGRALHLLRNAREANQANKVICRPLMLMRCAMPVRRKTSHCGPSMAA
jgi:thioredoxin-like negative regulator of GroEL